MGRRSVILATLFALLAASCSWTQYAGNAARTGANDFDREITPANVALLELLWQSDAGVLDATVISPDFIYAALPGGGLDAYDPNDPYACAGSPPACGPIWSAAYLPGWLEQAALHGGNVYLAQIAGDRWTLRAFDQEGGICPWGCMPEWSASWGSPYRTWPYAPKLAIADDLVYVAVGRSDGGAPPAVYVFPASGPTTCHATTCDPLFRADGEGTEAALPTVADGRLFVPVSTGVRVYDAHGVEGCSAGVCTPLYELSTGTGTPVSVSDGIAYAAVGGQLMAFDAAGIHGCGDVPRICEPRWHAELDGTATGQPPVLAGGHVFVVEYQAADGTGIEAYDASGQQGCSGNLITCEPSWRIPQSQMPGTASAASANGSLLFVSGTTSSLTGTLSELRTYDLAGSVGCAGETRTCTALSVHPLAPSGPVDAPSVGFGRVVISGGWAPMQVFGLPQQP